MHYGNKHTREINLPTGCKREEVIGQKGIHKGKIDIYVTAPGAKLFRLKSELGKYIIDKSLKFENRGFSLFKGNKRSMCSH